MMARSLVYGSVAMAGLMTGTGAYAGGHPHHDHHGHHPHHGGVSVGIGFGYRPQPVYAQPIYLPPNPGCVHRPRVYPQPVYPQPIYQQPVYVPVQPAPYPYGYEPYGPYAPYSTQGVGVNTKNFGLWLSR
jgi:hypothetical protein